MSDLERFVRERAESYGALRQSALTAVALDRAADRLRQYREALEWYADQEKWSDADSFHAVEVEWEDGNRCDFGERARTALKETTDVD